MKRIPLIRPRIPASAKEAVAKVLDSGFLTEGPVARQLEEELAALLGVPRALVVTSCTTGLEIALRAVGIGPGDEVLVPDFTYPASATAVLQVGADVALVDVDPDTMNVAVDQLARAVGPRTRAALPVSLFGNPLDERGYPRLRSEHGLKIVEDAACSLGASFGGRRVGSAADVTVFSLHPRKLLTTGEGGLITSQDEALLAWMDSFKHFGMEPGPERPRFVRSGTNAKLSDLLAAVGLAQLPGFEASLVERRRLADRYRELLADAPGLALPAETPGGCATWQSFCVRVPDRDRILTDLRAAGIEVQFGTFALHREPAFAPSDRVRHVGPFPGSEAAADQSLALPLFEGITDAEQATVVRELLARLPAA